MTDPDTGNGGPAVWEKAQIPVLNNGGVATAINDRGQVVGWNMEGTGFAEQSAFLWRDGKLTLLEFGTVNEATDINNRGQVVGTRIRRRRTGRIPRRSSGRPGRRPTWVASVGEAATPPRSTTGAR